MFFIYNSFFLPLLIFYNVKQRIYVFFFQNIFISLFAKCTGEVMHV